MGSSLYKYALYTTMESIRKMGSERPPAHLFVPIHCIPETFRISDSNKKQIACGATCSVIQSGKWYRSVFGDDRDPPHFFETLADKSQLHLAVRTLDSMRSDDALEFSENEYIITPVLNYALRSRRKCEKLAALQHPFLLNGVSKIRVLGFDPSPNNVSGWLRFQFLLPA